MKSGKDAISGEKSPLASTEAGQARTIWHYSTHDRRNFAHGEPHAPFDGGGHPAALAIGWDVEYVRQPGEKSNRILSYQFCALGPDGRYISGIHYCEDGKRMRFSIFIGNVIEVCLQEGLIQRWPKEVYLCAHYSLADLPCFEDQKKLFPIVDNVRKTFLSLSDSISIKYWDRQRHKHRVSVTLRDSKVLTPAGKGALKDIGELLGFEKFQLTKDEISHMDMVLAKQPELYRDYAIRDAEITVHYCDQMRRLNESLNSSNKIPTTLSSIGVAYILRTWEQLGINSDDVLGFKEVEEKVFSNGHYITQKRKVLQDEVELYYSFAIYCFHGGRNEQYFFGAAPKGLYTDYDLTGAYTTAMSLIGTPQWKGIAASKDPEMYQVDTLGYAQVQFAFPADTRFPCLPVRSSAGLIFPLKGVSFCCAPEIYQARRMGAIITILNGIILPQDRDSRPFGEFIKETTRRRKSYTKGTLFELFWKELANGVYGKTAQGTRKRNCYNPRSNSYEQLPPSKITNPYVAAWVTSFIRAVLAEILAALPAEVRVSNVTTDGILTNASKQVMDDCVNGPLCMLFQAGRYSITGKRECLEIKRHAEQVIGVRTRGQFTLVGIEGEKPILAKMGVKPPCDSDVEANEWMITALAERTPETSIEVPALRPLPDICREGGDLVEMILKRRLRMDFDWKRDVDLNTVTVSRIRDFDHLYFETIPWLTVDDCLACRENWEDFSRQKRVLKTEEDLRDFLTYKSLQNLPRGIQRPSKEPEEKIVKRQFLRAYVRFKSGLDREALTYREAAEILTALGFPTRKSDLENAARARSEFIPHALPRTPKILELLDLLKSKFPTFEPESLLKAPDREEPWWENAAHPGVLQSISLPPHLGNSNPQEKEAS